MTARECIDDSRRSVEPDGACEFEYAGRSSCICGTALAGSRARIDKRYAWGPVGFVQCVSCGSWCQSPLVTPDALARWIDSDAYQGSAGAAGVAYTNYVADEPNRLIEARERCRRDLAGILPPRSKVLEIGCATGSLLAALRELGHDVRGLDLSPRFCEYARRNYCLEVAAVDILSADLPLQSFDAVLAMGTVGNFRDFGACASRIRGLLRPGGAFVFNYPDADSWLVKLVYRDHYWMYTPSIGTFMTSRGCAAAMKRSGFDGLRVRTDVQRPSVQKLLKHARADFLLRAADALGFGRAAMPFSFPVPAVRFAVSHAPR